MFDQLLRALYESSAGRIRWFPNMWAVIGSRWDKNRIVNKNLIGSDRVNAKGEWERDGLTLVKRLCVTSCPQPPGDDFHKNQRETGFWVPATECRKCPYHSKANQQFRFPRCTFNRGTTKKEVAENTLNQFSAITDQAMQKTKEIMGDRS